MPFVEQRVWTTLTLTIYADGSSSHELAGASPFPRHWIYDAAGKLAGKSTLIDFKTWYRTATLARSPWSGTDNAVRTAEAETPLERRLSLMIMRGGGQPPRPARVKAGDAILAEGDAGDANASPRARSAATPTRACQLPRPRTAANRAHLAISRAWRNEANPA